MSKTLVKVLIDLTIPGSPDPESPNPPDEGPTSPMQELQKVIRDGCAGTYTYEVGMIRRPSDGDCIVFLEQV